MEALLKKIEAYGFECEAGSLQNCEDWQRLRTSIAELERQNAELQEDFTQALNRISVLLALNASIENEVAQLRQQLAASADKKRLDFLDRNKKFRMGWMVGIAPAGNLSIKTIIMGGAPIREAIDAARAGKDWSK